MLWNFLLMFCGFFRHICLNSSETWKNHRQPNKFTFDTHRARMPHQNFRNNSSDLQARNLSVFNGTPSQYWYNGLAKQENEKFINKLLIFSCKRDFPSPLNSLLQIWIWRSCFVLMVLSLISKLWHFDKLGHFLKKMTNKKRRSSVLSHASLGTPAPRGSDNGGGHDDTVESQVKPLERCSHISLQISSSNQYIHTYSGRV